MPSLKLASFSKIREQREARGLSTTQFAYKLGISQSSAVRLEQSEARGAISLITLQRAAAALDCELVWELRLTNPRRAIAHAPSQAYPGLRRVRSGSDDRGPSAISDRAREQEQASWQKLSIEQRVLLGCELSNLTWSVKQCSSKR